MKQLLYKIKSFIAKQSPILIFSFSLFILTVMYWFLFVIFDGRGSYFFSDYNDTFMDYYNVLSWIEEGDPYSHVNNYPPLLFIFLMVVYKMIPIPYREMHLDSFTLRGLSTAQITFVLYLILCLSALFGIIMSFFPSEKKRSSVIFSVSIILSAPVIYTIERGNFILISLVFLLLFLRFYRSERLCLRLLSYFALALATALKIYPVVFGVLVIFEKRYWEAALLVLIGFLLFFIPFFAFGGISDIGRMLDGVKHIEATQDGLVKGSNFNFSLKNLIYIIGEILGARIETNTYLVMLIAFLTLLPLLFLSSNLFDRVLTLTLIMIWVPAYSYTYTLMFFLLPLIVFLKSNEKISKHNIVYLIIFVLLFAPYISIRLNKKSPYPLAITTGTLFVNIVLITLIIYHYIVNILLFIRNKKTKLISKEVY